MSSIKECLIMITWIGLMVLLALRTSSAYPLYGLTPYIDDDAYDMPNQDQLGVKRGFWEKRSSKDMTWNDDGIGGYPFAMQWNERNKPDKRGFGSMMPAYLVHMYRPDIPVLPPKSLFSPPRQSSERGKRSNDR
ncbi:hypothetical protein SK128_001249 [Halocaridina rubra]|uniref:Uncharacterized protein n=1 Tax=Halocaridina rubra TaxID=373956 RepID=A0AAN9FUB7_HALRR